MDINPIVMVDWMQIYFFCSDQSLSMYKEESMELRTALDSSTDVLRTVAGKSTYLEGYFSSTLKLAVGLEIVIPKKNTEERQRKLSDMLDVRVLDGHPVLVYRRLKNCDYSRMREGSLYLRDVPANQNLLSSKWNLFFYSSK